MVLSARPGHRGEPSSSIQHRWEMLKIACNNFPNLIADDGEVRREGKSYTFETVKDYRERGYVANWVVGMDSFVTMPEWYRWEEIPEYCNLIVIERLGMSEHLPSALSQIVAERQVEKLDIGSTGQIWFLEESMLDVSATEIRRRVMKNEDPSDLLDDAVWSYIKQHNLYAEVSV